MTPHPYTITSEDLHSVTKQEMAFGCTRLLPPFDESTFPDDYEEILATPAHQICNALFYGMAMPDVDMQYRPGFSHEHDAGALRCATLAHLRSFAPKHEHKIYGVCKMILQVLEFK